MWNGSRSLGQSLRREGSLCLLLRHRAQHNRIFAETMIGAFRRDSNGCYGRKYGKSIPAEESAFFLLTNWENGIILLLTYWKGWKLKGRLSHGCFSMSPLSGEQRPKPIAIKRNLKELTDHRIYTAADQVIGKSPPAEPTHLERKSGVRRSYKEVLPI